MRVTKRPRLFVHPHPTGPWLVVVGRRRLAVPPALGARLHDLDGSRPGAAELAGRLGGDDTVARLLLAARARPRRHGAPWLRIPVLPGSWVRVAAVLLAPLTGASALVALAGGGLTAALLGRHPAAVTAGSATHIVALALLVGSGLVHELGHAAALARAGYPPGRIGVGMLAVIPVLWCDVSAVAMLPPRARLRVDLAGPVFQLAAAGLVAVSGRVAGGTFGAAAALAASGALIAAAWSATPFFRADGFWALSDLVGRGPLDRLPQPGDDRGTLGCLVVYRFAHAVFFLAIAVVVLRRASAGGCAGPLALAVGLLLGGTVLLRLFAFARAWARWRAPQIR